MMLKLNQGLMTNVTFDIIVNMKTDGCLLKCVKKQIFFIVIWIELVPSLSTLIPSKLYTLA